MRVTARERERSGSGQGEALKLPARGARNNSGQGAKIDVAELLKAPEKNIPLLREIALGHRESAVRWKCVCALAALPADAADALTLILRESTDSAVRHRADRALRPIAAALGALVMTGTAFAVLHREDVKEALLRRHARGDWGDLCREDWEANEQSLFENGRLFSVYHDRSGQKFYIITEYDRSLTTILLPEDY
jgi:hypothetical protein